MTDIDYTSINDINDGFDADNDDDNDDDDDNKI
jgi:hypothetical protein